LRDIGVNLNLNAAFHKPISLALDQLRGDTPQLDLSISIATPVQLPTAITPVAIPAATRDELGRLSPRHSVWLTAAPSIIPDY
jgi:hypothetical protein